MDEISIATTTQVTQVRRDAERIEEWTWSPATFGLEISPIDSIVVDGPEASAKLIQQVLEGQPGPARDIVVLNAAAALWLAGRRPSPMDCAQLAQDAIDSGAAKALLANLARVSHQE